MRTEDTLPIAIADAPCGVHCDARGNQVLVWDKPRTDTAVKVSYGYLSIGRHIENPDFIVYVFPHELTER